jgi:HAMP domain-containing protein
MHLIRDAVETLLARGPPRTLRVLGASARDSAVMVDIVMPEAAMRTAMLDYSARILTLSLVLSGIVASLLFLSLQVLIVRPLRRITGELAAFRERPEDAAGDPALPRHQRADEIGVVEGELAAMRRDLRRALAEKTRLAALGAALGRVSHELRNILSSAALVSDRLAVSADPQVRQLGARVMESLDRAIRLSAETLRYAGSRPEPPAARPVVLAELVDRVRADLADRPEPVRWRVAGLDPDLTLLADPDQLHRVLLNLARNAYEAMGLGRRRGRGQRHRRRRRGRRPTARARRHRAGHPGAGPRAPVRAVRRHHQAGRQRARPGDLPGADAGAGGRHRAAANRPRRHHIRADPAAARDPARRRPPETWDGFEACRRRDLLLLATALGACSWRGPSLAGYDGLQFEVISFYDANAMEKNATCPQPRMQAVTRAQVVEETPQRVVMNIKYHFRDEGQADYDNDDGFPPFGGGGS